MAPSTLSRALPPPRRRRASLQTPRLRAQPTHQSDWRRCWRRCWRWCWRRQWRQHWRWRRWWWRCSWRLLVGRGEPGTARLRVRALGAGWHTENDAARVWRSRGQWLRQRWWQPDRPSQQLRSMTSRYESRYEGRRPSGFAPCRSPCRAPCRAPGWAPGWAPSFDAELRLAGSAAAARERRVGRGESAVCVRRPAMRPIPYARRSRAGGARVPTKAAARASTKAARATVEVVVNAHASADSCHRHSSCRQ